MEAEKVKIFVATHKPAEKFGGECYQFIQVGVALHPDIQVEGALKDNANVDNISERNDIFCELTGLYYIWKHVKDVDYTGLVHYRRFLAHREAVLNPKNKGILTEAEIFSLLKKSDIIVASLSPKRGERNGYFKIKEEIPEFCIYRLVKPAIKELYPEYLEEFEAEFRTKKLSPGNIMICSKSLFDEYCEWLFNILFLVEKQLNASPFGIAPRELGYFSEYLMNVWIRKKSLKVCYKPILFIEDTSTLVRKVRLYLKVIGLSSVARLIDSVYARYKHGK